MCVGMHRVPVVAQLADDEDGQLKRHMMVHLSVAQRTVAPWLAKTLLQGGSLDAAPLKNVPLFEELRHAVTEKRHKRKGNTWVDKTGRVLPALLPVQVRGQKLIVANDLKTLSVNLGEDLGLVNWFLKQVWEDMGADHVKGSCPPREPGPDPCDKVPGLQARAEALVQKLKKHKSVHSATWQARQGRFRVCTIKKAIMHKQVHKWTSVVATRSADSVMTSLTDCCDTLLGDLDEEPTEQATAEDAPESPPQAAAGEDAPESPTQQEAAAAGA